MILHQSMECYFNNVPYYILEKLLPKTIQKLLHKIGEKLHDKIIVIFCNFIPHKIIPKNKLILTKKSVD